MSDITNKTNNEETKKKGTTKTEPKKKTPDKKEKETQENNPALNPNVSHFVIELPLNNLGPNMVEYEDYEDLTNELAEELLENIRDWLTDVSFVEFREEIKKSVIGQENLDLVLANVYNYLVNIANNNPTNNNMLMAAPSGCGKTETYRAIKKYFHKEIPDLVVCQVDVSVITEEGIIGGGTELLVSELMASGTGGYGIVFMDEFDKKLIPSFAEGANTSAAVQNQLLTIIEGREVQDIQDGMTTGYSVDTTRTMFIGLGSFNESREQKKKSNHNNLGFGASNITHDYFEDVSREDMIKMGASYEMIGRFPLIVNYHKLTEEAVDLIINKTVKELEEAYHLPIVISDEMKESLHKQANGVYGCRMLDSCIRNQVIKQYTKWLLESDKYKAPAIKVNSDNESELFDFCNKTN